MTSLLKALKENNLESVQTVLVENENKNDGIDTINKPFYSGQSPLAYACEYCSIDIVKMLLDHGADPNTALFGRNTFDIFMLLILHGADVTKKKRNESFVTFINNCYCPRITPDDKFKLLKFMLESHIEYKLTLMDYKSLSIFRSDNIRLLNYLFTDENIKKYNLSPFITDIFYDGCFRSYDIINNVNIDAYKTIIKYISPVFNNTNFSMTPLQLICSTKLINNAEIFSIFLDKFKGIESPFTITKTGDSPLITLLKNKCLNTIDPVKQLIMAYEGNIDVEDHMFMTPFLLACHLKLPYELQTQLIDFFIEKGCNVHQVNYSRDGALHLASSFKIMKYILNAIDPTSFNISLLNKRSQVYTSVEKQLLNLTEYGNCHNYDEVCDYITELLNKGAIIGIDAIKAFFKGNYNYGYYYLDPKTQSEKELILSSADRKYKIYDILINHCRTHPQFNELIFSLNCGYINEYENMLEYLLTHGCDVNATIRDITFLQHIVCNTLQHKEQQILNIVDIILKYGYKIPTEQQLLEMSAGDCLFEKFIIKSVRQHVADGSVTTALKMLKYPIVKANVGECCYTTFDGYEEEGNRICTNQAELFLVCKHGYCREHFFKKFRIPEKCSMYLGKDTENECIFCDVMPEKGISGFGLDD